jgi:hypothetical protein
MPGFVFYRGPSMIDGSPIVAIATATASRNTKTGAMVQTWIMRSDVDPLTASKEGLDTSICGTCKHRGKHDKAGRLIAKTRSCYVTLFQAPLTVWRTERRGRYEDLSGELETAAGRLNGLKLRLGSYGDPAAVPFHVWTALLSQIIGHTGYTHQWASFPQFAAFVMASCDSTDERAQAKFLGFRTFRVAPAEGWTKDAGEALCPASAEAGHKTTCFDCRACAGLAAKAKADIVIPAHGTGKSYV